LDYVYICRDGDNEELRYSIRSVAKYMPPGKIWVVGGKPDWYTGNYIRVAQHKSKYHNARVALKTIARSLEISEDFVLLNDDFFVVQKVNKIKTYHGGELYKKVDRYKDFAPRSIYTGMIDRTLNTLQRAHGILEPLDYELHVPLPMTRGGLMHVLNYSDMLWRSAYGNLFNVGGSQIVDVKIYADSHKEYGSYNYKDKVCPYVSTEDASFNFVYHSLLKGLLSEPSPFENTSLKVPEVSLPKSLTET
jgi:hypothetical protein